MSKKQTTSKISNENSLVFALIAVKIIVMRREEIAMPRKGENIYKRSDGRWEGRYIKSRHPTGKAQYGYVYAKSYREAKTKLAHAVRACNISEINAHKNEKSINLRELAAEWMSLRHSRMKESTQVKYQNLLNAYVLPTIGERLVEELTNEYLETFCNELLCSGGVKQSGLSPKTVSDVLSLIRNILRYAGDSGRTPGCDARSITIKQDSKEMRILNRSEQERLCQYLRSNPTPMNMGILLCLFTGLRVGEICALHWEDISLCERTLHIHQTMQRIQVPESLSSKTKVIVTTPKSPCSVRIIPIPDDLVNELYRQECLHEGYFLTASDQAFIEPRTMQNHFKRVLLECSICEANFHSLRHTFATRCVELGFDIKTLSEILGHASVTITMNRYVHPSIELKRDNMERLSALFAVK